MTPTFRASVDATGATTTGIRVPADVVAALGTSRKPAVVATVAGHAYRTTIATRGGEFLLSVSAAVREAAGVAAGDEVEVEVALDTAPREITVPADLAAALAPHPEARAFFDGLSYSQRRWFVDGIESAKKPETRQRRIDQAVERLRTGRGQR